LNARFLIALLAVVPLFAGSPRFLGIAQSRGETWFAVTDPASGGTRWVRVGGQIAQYRVVKYVSADETLLIDDGANPLRLKLNRGELASAATDRAQLLAVAQEQVRIRDGWASDVAFGRPHWFDGHWWIYAHHAGQGGSELRRIVLDSAGTVVSYDMPPD
jgi:hypothetical protein